MGSAILYSKRIGVALDNILLQIFYVRLPSIIFTIKEYIWNNKELMARSSFELKREKLGMEVVYSSLNDNYFINFNNRGDNRISIVKGDQLPVLRVTGTATNIRLSGITVQSGDNKLEIERAMYLNYEDFLYFIVNTKKFLDSMVYASILELEDAEKPDKMSILNEFDRLLRTNPGELAIDKFIELNSFILEYGLHVSNLHHQIILKSIEEDFEQNLKPDVIAWQNLEKRWVIIDYKKYDKKIVKKPWRARSGLMAEVRDLESQLRDYIDYFFRSKSQTDFITNEYGMNVIYPHGYGIIGGVQQNQNEEFLKAIYPLPNNIKIIPYNYLIDECRRVISLS